MLDLCAGWVILRCDGWLATGGLMRREGWYARGSMPGGCVPGHGCCKVVVEAVVGESVGKKAS